MHAIVLKDDEIKLARGLDTDRCEQAYEASDGEADALQRHFARHYCQPPSSNELQAAMQKFARFRDHVAVVIPMRERGHVIRPVLSVLTKQVAPASIVVVNDGSDDDALNEVRSHDGVKLIFRDDILDVLDWSRLLPVLNLKERPSGKGVAVLAGYLLHYFRARKTLRLPVAVLQNDAEIAEYERYQCLQHLAHGFFFRQDAQYVKTAKFGRTNETGMAARSMMHVLAQSKLNGVKPAVRKRAQELFWRTTPHKWMQTGEFMLTWNLAMSRPFATGYLEESLCTMFAEDTFAGAGKGCTVQVANPNPRLDAANDERKERIMQQQIGNFFLQCALFAVPTHKWTLKTIQKVNEGFISATILMGWIAPNDGPVVAEAIRNDRVIPSVRMLAQGGLIDKDAVSRLMQKLG